MNPLFNRLSTFVLTLGLSANPLAAEASLHLSSAGQSTVLTESLFQRQALAAEPAVIPRHAHDAFVHMVELFSAAGPRRFTRRQGLAGAMALMPFGKILLRDGSAWSADAASGEAAKQSIVDLARETAANPLLAKIPAGNLIKEALLALTTDGIDVVDDQTQPFCFEVDWTTRKLKVNLAYLNGSINRSLMQEILVHEFYHKTPLELIRGDFVLSIRRQGGGTLKQISEDPFRRRLLKISVSLTLLKEEAAFVPQFAFAREMAAGKFPTLAAYWNSIIDAKSPEFIRQSYTMFARYMNPDNSFNWSGYRQKLLFSHVFPLVTKLTLVASAMREDPALAQDQVMQYVNQSSDPNAINVLQNYTPYLNWLNRFLDNPQSLGIPPSLLKIDFDPTQSSTPHLLKPADAAIAMAA